MLLSGVHGTGRGGTFGTGGDLVRGCTKLCPRGLSSVPYGSDGEARCAAGGWLCGMDARRGCAEVRRLEVGSAARKAPAWRRRRPICLRSLSSNIQIKKNRESETIDVSANLQRCGLPRLRKLRPAMARTSRQVRPASAGPVGRKGRNPCRSSLRPEPRAGSHSVSHLLAGRTPPAAQTFSVAPFKPTLNRPVPWADGVEPTAPRQQLQSQLGPAGG